MTAILDLGRSSSDVDVATTTTPTTTTTTTPTTTTTAPPTSALGAPSDPPRSARERLACAAQLLAFTAAVFVLSLVAVELTPSGSDVAPWWPAAGIAAAAFTSRHRYRALLAPAVFLACALANGVGGRPWTVAVGFALSNTAEAWAIGAWLNRGVTERPRLRRLRDVWQLVIAASLGVTAIAGGAALTVWAFTDGDPVRTIANVVPSHASAILLFVPFSLAAAPARRRPILERVGLWVATIGVVLVVFAPAQELPLSFLPTVLVMWSAVRLGLRSAVAQLVVVAVTVTILSTHGLGPFAGWAAGGAASTTGTNAMIQLFIMANAVVLLPLAVALAERESAMARAQASEMLYRAGFSEAIVGMMLVGLEPGCTRVIEVNDAAGALLGLQPGVPMTGALVDRHLQSVRTIADRLPHGAGWGGEMRLVDDEARRFNVAVTKLSQLDDAPPIASVQLIETTEQHRIELELERMALSDPLTGLPNRAALIGHVDAALATAAATGEQVAVMFFDLDDFKLVNDAYGHRAGDDLLVEFARRLDGTVRHGDTLARVGGDEFVLLCPRVASIEEAREIAERIWLATAEPIDLGGLSYEVNLSVGLTTSRRGSTTEQLLVEADVAMYAAKADGKRRLAVYSDELGDRACERVQIEADLRAALRGGEFEMYMQPVVDVLTERVVAAEALIRWNHPTDGVRPPGSWLAVAERAGMLSELGAWVLDDSVRQAAGWASVLGSERAPAVHVNVSARQLDHPGFADIVVAALGRHGLPGHLLVLELTETHLASVPPELVAELNALAELGVRIAADDYGTGYSPLTRIIELPISMIKIDRQFISNAAADDRSGGVVRALLQLGCSLGLDVVAEGVETPAQLGMLRVLGCAQAQGYLWSRPVPGDEFAAMIDASVAPGQPARSAVPSSRSSSSIA